MIATAPRTSVTRTALLGMRFWDRVSGRSIADGLEVRETGSGRAATPSHGGVFVFHDLPGLRDASYGAGDEAFSGSPPAGRVLTFEVTDRDGRFIPFRFTADVPRHGLFAPPCVAGGSPPGGPAALPLFSAPTRLAPPGLAAIRADLWDTAAGAPAAGAVLEVAGTGLATCAAVADAEGRVVVLCPYPEPRWPGMSPPPGSSALAEQHWILDASVRYRAGLGWPRDVCETLTQPPATPLAGDAPPVPLPPQTLLFGRELVLRSAGRSVLLVRPS